MASTLNANTPTLYGSLPAQSPPINTRNNDNYMLSQFQQNELSTTKTKYQFTRYLMVPLILVAKLIVCF